MILLKSCFVKNKFRLRLLYSDLSKEHMYEVLLAFRAQVERTGCSLNILFFLYQLR